MGEILRVEDLKKYFATKKGTLHAVDGVTFTVEAGKTLGIVGESGCGKSTLGRVILHLHERTEGRIVFQGEDISDVSNAKLKELRKDMQIELKRIQQQVGITFVYVTHDQEEALTMSDTVVVMNEGRIQQIGTPQDIYNEPKNAFVADFIGESNIIDGIMHEDRVVGMYGKKFPCLDGGFQPNEPVDVVIRPEDIDIVPVEQGQLTGTVTEVTFKGMHYDIIVDFKGFKWLIQTTDFSPVGARIGVKIDPDGFHIMKKSRYSGMFGDYSSYSSEYDELNEGPEEGNEDEE